MCSTVNSHKRLQAPSSSRTPLVDVALFCPPVHKFLSLLSSATTLTSAVQSFPTNPSSILTAMAPYLSAEGFESHTARADQVNYKSPLDDAVNATSALPPASINNMLDFAHPPTSHTDAFNTSNGTTTNGHAERASSSSSSETLPTSTPIAIVGLSCKFSGDATDASKFWDLCRTGKDSWSEMPKERFNAEAFYHPDAQRTGRVSDLGSFYACRSLDRFPRPRARMKMHFFWGAEYMFGILEGLQALWSA